MLAVNNAFVSASLSGDQSLSCLPPLLVFFTNKTSGDTQWSREKNEWYLTSTSGGPPRTSGQAIRSKSAQHPNPTHFGLSTPILGRSPLHHSPSFT